MTAWNPDGGGGTDQLVHGDENPPARPGRLLAAGALLLVVGAAMGVQVGDQLPWDRAPTPTLAAGEVSSAQSVTDRDRFRVLLFNPGDDSVRARVIGLAGFESYVAGGTTVEVPAHGWETASFSVPDMCSLPRLSAVEEVTVRVAGTAEPADQLVRLSGPAAAVGAVQAQECRTATVLRPRGLAGLWILEKDEGRWSGLARRGLMRLDPDGRFAFDPEGHVFEEHRQGFFGRYRLKGSRLYLTSEGGYACPAGYSEVWTITMLAKDRLRLDIVRSGAGYCHNPSGERQYVRRLVKADSLPAALPLSARRR